MQALHIVKTACLPDDYKAQNQEKANQPQPTTQLPLYQRTSAKVFLTVYNSFLALGWFAITFSILKDCVVLGWSQALSEAYDNFHRPILFLQAVLVVDIFNLLFGLVPPPAFGFFHTVSCKVTQGFFVFSFYLFLPGSEKKPHFCDFSPFCA